MCNLSPGDQPVTVAYGVSCGKTAHWTGTFSDMSNVAANNE